MSPIRWIPAIALGWGFGLFPGAPSVAASLPPEDEVRGFSFALRSLNPDPTQSLEGVAPCPNGPATQTPSPPADSSPAKPSPATPPSLFPEGYLDHEALGAALKRLAEEVPELVHLRSIARTHEGRDVWLVTLARHNPPAQKPEPSSLPAAPPAASPPNAEPKPRPSILLVANLEADHLIGSQVALRLLERVARDPAWADRLGCCSLHVIPRLNPDGAERLLKSPRLDFRTNLEPIDRDRDGRFGEDGPDDLNGDGLILRMRVKDGKATLTPDPADPRVLRKADTAKGERPVYSEYWEGFDNDGDGQLDEDPPGGVNLNRNWPYRWTEYDAEAGFSPVSQPETRALVQFAFDHPEIAVIWSLGLNDNLTTAPRKPESGLDEADLPLFAELSRLFQKAAASHPKRPGAVESSGSPKEGENRTDGAATPPPAQEPGRVQERGQMPTSPPPEAADSPSTAARGKPTGPAEGPASPRPPTAPAVAGATTDGALSEWAYHHYGVVGLASRLWSGPELPAPTPKGKEEQNPNGGAEPAPEGGKPAAPPPPAVPTGSEARWLLWNDHVMGGQAFVPFAPFAHPTLGTVELGGWKPGVRLNPPIEEVEPIIQTCMAFLGELSTKLPRLELQSIQVESKGSGVFQVSAAIVNEGYLPTALAQGIRSRNAPPVQVRFEAANARILAGPTHTQIESLGGMGGRRELVWLVLAPTAAASPPPSVTIRAFSPKAGVAVRTIALEQRE